MSEKESPDLSWVCPSRPMKHDPSFGTCAACRHLTEIIGGASLFCWLTGDIVTPDDTCGDFHPREAQEGADR